MKLSKGELHFLTARFKRFFDLAETKVEDRRLLIWAKDSVLRLVAYSSDTWMVWSHEWPGESFAGSVLLGHLAGIGFEAPPGEEVMAEASDKRLTLTSARLCCEVPLESKPLEWTTRYQLERVWGDACTVPHTVVIRAMAHAVSAVGQESVRPNLRAAALTGEIVVATDGHRLHTAEFQVPLAEGRSPVILPPLAVRVMAAGMQFRAPRVRIGKQFFHLASGSGMWELYAEFSTASFPNWEAMLSVVGMDFELEVHTSDLLSALRYGASFRLPVSLFFKGQEIEVQPVAGSGVWGVARLKFTSVSGRPPDAMCFNPWYLIEALAGSVSEVVQVKGTDSDGGLMLSSGDRMFAIVMPMRR